MAAIARRWRTGLGLLVAGSALLWAGACSSQQEASLSALHYFQRGNAAFQAEAYGRAIEHYQMALKFDPEAPDIHYNLGLAYYRAAAYAEAASSFQEALRQDPAFAEAHLNLALCLDKLYNANAANLHYNRYRELMLGARERETAATTPAARPATAAAGAPPAAGAAQAAASRGGGMPAGLSRSNGPPPAKGSPGQPGTQPVGQTRTPDRAPARAPETTPIQQPPNPYQGNSKWWTQDAASLNR